jgi:phage-related protein
LLFGYLPVYFKVGYLKSRMLNLVVFAILGVVIAGISLLMDAIGVTSLGISTTAMVLIVLVLWIILGLVSYTLATRFFAKRTL